MRSAATKSIRRIGRDSNGGSSVVFFSFFHFLLRLRIHIRESRLVIHFRNVFFVVVVAIYVSRFVVFRILIDDRKCVQRHTESVY